MSITVTQRIVAPFRAKARARARARKAPPQRTAAPLHGGPYLELFTTRRPSQDEARIWVHEEGYWWAPNEAEERADRGAPFTLASFLATMIDRELREEIRTRIPVAVPERIPFLIATDSVSTQRQEVIHPKFGRGSLLRRIGDGPDAKLVIDFDGTERTIAARFIKEA